ncbi:5-(carboxyamino)imidazole ribonucleotide synthase [Kocuria palustris]|uniref:5-(carboxyamino)imidazole ribonucleotide synthase n=1 Tax=Kocuria palustris TaxID=71999 RepID=UPI0011AAE79C|nr:5-(carboxyamino)imidazole ribonucleotide synthase [Kocuria palustris]
MSDDSPQTTASAPASEAPGSERFSASGPVVGVVGGGQLARMMGPAAAELGIELRVLAESEEAAAVPAAASHRVGAGDDLEALRGFSRGLDALTFDHEHVPNEHLEALLADGVVVEPRPHALIHAQDKIVMRRAVDRLGLPNPRWAEVSDADALVAFAGQGQWPVVLKTPRGGYDGKGVLLVHSEQEARTGTAAEWFDRSAAPLLAEEAVPFARELSAQVARRRSGEQRCWPVVESIQVDGVCDEVIAPAPGLSPEESAAAQRIALRLSAELDVTGVMAVELFQTRDGSLLVNELAMRPHNSGHWSMDGAVTGQFEQHLRAVLDLPLGCPEPVAAVAVMKNILGGDQPNLHAGLTEAMAAHPRAKVHLYGKSVRPGRKVGHVNALSAAGQPADEGVTAEVRRTASAAAAVLRDGPGSH